VGEVGGRHLGRREVQRRVRGGSRPEGLGPGAVGQHGGDLPGGGSNEIATANWYSDDVKVWSRQPQP